MYPHLASRVFNTAHLIEPQAGRTIIGALGSRLDVDTVQMPDGTAVDAATLANAAAAAPGRTARPLFEQVGAIAVIRATGTLVHRFGHLDPVSGMTGYDGLEAKLEAALDDPAIEGIIFDIDSPGGEVAGCFDLADRIYEARGQKPIWAVADELCASAAYALASACTRIVAPRTARLGSIGVLTAHVDQSQMLKGAGVAVTLIHAGRHKVDANPYEPLPDDVRDDMQAQIDALYGQFVELVARNRRMSADAVRDTQARVFDAERAKAAGLVDAVMPARDVLGAFEQSLRPRGVSMQNLKERGMALFTRTRQTEPTADAGGEPKIYTEAEARAQFAPSEPVYTEAEARAAFGPNADAVSLETLVEQCAQNNLHGLAQPLRKRGVSAQELDAILADANAVRDKMAVTIPEDPQAAAALADKFVIAAHGGGTPQFADALASLMVEVQAVMAGEEIDHHPPTGDMASAGALNAVDFYNT